MVVGEFSQETDLLVLGGGPGGYTAAFRAAGLGMQVTIVEATPALGGVCLHRGCIPSKTFLSMAETLATAEHAEAMGIKFSKPKIDLAAARKWKQQVIDKLAKGLDSVAKKNKVQRLEGTARFTSSKECVIEGKDAGRIKFRKAIIATGSVPIRLPKIEADSDRVIDSTGALEMPDVPKRLLVLGGGYIGLELGMVYAAMGSKVTVVEMMDQLLPGADADLVKPLAKHAAKSVNEICLETRVTGMKDTGKGIEVSFDGKNVPAEKVFDKVLVSVGRRPNTGDLGLENTKAKVDDRGFIEVDDQLRTDDPKIWAIGDVIGNPMLAHKASHEGRIAAEVIAGLDSVNEPRAIPAVVFTDPEIAWCGLTEREAKEQGVNHKVIKVSWLRSGRAVSIDRTEGMTKLIVDPESERILGIAMVGPHVGEMIAEGVLALEMGATATDLAETVHPHPTLSETVGDAAIDFVSSAGA
jgi:dihydrolipoamide dehydrogenase